MSGLTFLDSAPGGAGVVARLLSAFEEIRGAGHNTLENPLLKDPITVNCTLL